MAAGRRLRLRGESSAAMWAISRPRRKDGFAEAPVCAGGRTLNGCVEAKIENAEALYFSKSPFPQRTHRARRGLFDDDPRRRAAGGAGARDLLPDAGGHMVE